MVGANELAVPLNVGSLEGAQLLVFPFQTQAALQRLPSSSIPATFKKTRLGQFGKKRRPQTTWHFCLKVL